MAFNDLVASCGSFGDGDSWIYTAMQDTTLLTIAQSSLDVRFYVAGLANDLIDLGVNNGLGWQVLEAFEVTNLPPAALTTLTYDVSGLFSTPAQVNAAQIQLVTHRRGSADPITIYLDEARLNVVDIIPTPTPVPPVPTPTTAPPAPTDIPGFDDPHVDYAASTFSCAGCHRAHTSTGIVLRHTWPEEDLCFTCHAPAGLGTDVQTALTSYTNTDTSFFKHDVMAYNGIHRLGHTTGSDFGGANRHVECEDCHEPHEATRGWASAPMLQPEMNFTSGVDPVWTGAGAPISYTWLPQAEREYQTCFKCHSSFTTLPGYLPDGWNGSTYVADGLPKLTNPDPAQVLDSRDLGQEFNPYQASFHPVVAQGRNQSIPVESFVSGWSQTRLTYCTDCHTNANAAIEGDGPHGSPRLHILDGQAEYSTVYGSGSRVDGQEICFKCHNFNTYVTGLDGFTNFPYHERHLNSNRGTTCYTCHDTHGSEQLHLINFDASTMTFLNGRNSQTAWTWDVSGQASCYLICHSRSHNPLTYTP
jgi:predicted CXXCH cytochrome family protein